MNSRIARSSNALTSWLKTCLMTLSILTAEAQSVFPVGGPGDDRLTAVHALSDGTLLVGGATTDPSWLPTGPTLEGDFGELAEDPSTAILLHLSDDLSKLLGHVRFPKGFATDIARISSTEVPGAPSGDLHVGGTLADGSGYFIAKLDQNFLTQAPAKASWVHRVQAKGKLIQTQPWDVGPEGRVIFVRGEPYGYNWLAIEALGVDGKPCVVPEWPRHWTADGEYAGPASTAPSPPTHSGIVIKTKGRGDFRSSTKEDFLMESSDGNGGLKKGRWPLDAMFDGPFDPVTKKTIPVTGTKKGYYGYRWGGAPCGNVSAICVDRRTGAIFIGGNNKSRLPDGKPDFEPWVVGQAKSGKTIWWQRLYPESKGVSTPDQYVDAVAIDYSVSPEDDGALTVLGRCHGNNVNNLWKGHEIQHPDNPGRSFQHQFTGSHGNIHISWLGRMTMTGGTMLHASYIAEFYEASKFDMGSKHPDPLVTGWPNPNAGWPNLNTTRGRALKVDSKGRPFLLATGKWTQTTSNAFQRMPGPLEPGAQPWWTDFVRVYQKDLTNLDYSSLITNQAHASVQLRDLAPIDGAVVVTGYTKNETANKEVPSVNAPGWAGREISGQKAMLGLLPF